MGPQVTLRQLPRVSAQFGRAIFAPRGRVLRTRAATFLGALVRTDRRAKRMPTPERIEELKDQARTAATAAGRRN
jgi:hypothetical protein